MSQGYTKDKDIALKKLSSGRRLLEAVLVVVGVFAFYLMVALVSFSPSDPSWSQTAWHGHIYNLGGGVGAWFADTLFFTFGVLAYALPPIMLFFCWSAFAQRDRRNYVDLFGLSLRLIGSLALLLTSCGLAALNVDDLYYFASGGVIGSLLSNTILPWFNGIGSTLALLCVWASGLTLFTGWSWLTIAEKIGAVVLGCLTFVSNRSRRDDDEDYDYSRAAAEDEDDTLPRVAEGDEDDPQLRPLAAAVAAHRGAPGPVVASGHPAASARVHYPAEGTWVEHASSRSLPLALADEAPRYRFELPETPADSLALGTEDEGPRMGDWRQEPDAPHTPYDFTVAPLTFMPAFSASGNDYNPQVKQGIGQELPRPKPVRIPTRRKLTSYGIKIPLQQRPLLDGPQDVAQQADAAMRPAFASAEEEAAWDEKQRLAQDFARQQLQRYPGAAPDDDRWPDDDAPWHDDDDSAAAQGERAAPRRRR